MIIFFSTGHSVEPGLTVEIAKNAEIKGKLCGIQSELGQMVLIKEAGGHALDLAVVLCEGVVLVGCIWRVFPI